MEEVLVEEGWEELLLALRLVLGSVDEESVPV